MEWTVFQHAMPLLILLTRWAIMPASAKAFGSNQDKVGIMEAVSQSAQMEIRSGGFMELETDSSNSLRTMSDLIAEIQHLSVDAYNEKVLESGAEDILERWWRRHTPRDSTPPEAVPFSKVGNNSASEGLYAKIQRKQDEVRRARLLRQEISHKTVARATGTSEQMDQAERGTPKVARPSDDVDIRKLKMNVSIHEIPEPSKTHKVTEDASLKALQLEHCFPLDPHESHFGFPGCVADTSANVHLVVSAFDSKIAWLADVRMPMTIYVHNRSASRGRCISNGQKCVAVETPAKLHKAAESQRDLVAHSKKRPKDQQIQFLDVPNIGDEALGYLMHIVGHWDHLPDFVFFTHDHQCAWHSKFDMAAILARAQQCMPGHDIGYMTLNDPDLYGGQPECFSTSSSHEHDFSGETKTIRRIWPVLFESEFGRLPPKFCMDCCAQFVVSRKLIRSHPLDFYKRALSAVKTGRTSFEYFWRTLFVPHFA